MVIVMVMVMVLVLVLVLVLTPARVLTFTGCTGYSHALVTPFFHYPVRSHENKYKSL